MMEKQMEVATVDTYSRPKMTKSQTGQAHLSKRYGIKVKKNPDS